MVETQSKMPISVALFLPNWVGDVVMATPAVRAIRRRYPRPHRLIGIIRPKMAELLAGTDWFDVLWTWEPRWWGRGPSQWDLLQRMRQERVDLLVLFTNSLRSACLGLLGKARQRVGYVRDGRGWLLTGRLYPRSVGGRIAPAPMVFTYLALAEAVGCPPESPRLELSLTPEEEEQGKLLFRRLGFYRNRPTVALVYAGAQGPARRWPVGHYVDLARKIASSGIWQVLVVVGPSEREIGWEICKKVADPRVRTTADEPHHGLSITKAALAACDICISTDSGPRHIAAAFGKPVITLYGPTDPIWGANPTVHSVDLFVDLPCRGCLQPVCPLGHHRCMQELSPERVYEAFSALASEIEVRRLAAAAP